MHSNDHCPVYHLDLTYCLLFVIQSKWFLRWIKVTLHHWTKSEFDSTWGFTMVPTESLLTTWTGSGSVYLLVIIFTFDILAKKFHHRRIIGVLLVQFGTKINSLVYKCRNIDIISNFQPQSRVIRNNPSSTSQQVGHRFRFLDYRSSTSIRAVMIQYLIDSRR